MRTLIGCCFYISLLLMPVQTFADMEVADIRLPHNHTIDNQSLVLNGAGIRSKFFVKVYVGALYLNNTTQSAATAITADGSKSMQMVMLYKEVEAEKITRGWDDGFRNNLTETEFDAVAERLEKFNSLFPNLHQGDHIFMDFQPGKGMQLKINERAAGHIDGDDFFSALLKVWLGESPADKQLKKALLGL